MQVWATIHDTRNGSSVSGARVEVQLVWRGALPGSDAAAPPMDLPSVLLSERPDGPGRYEGSLATPDIEGYYQLQATVEVSGQPPVLLEELILVERSPQAKQAAPGLAGQPAQEPAQREAQEPIGREEPEPEIEGVDLGTLGLEDVEEPPAFSREGLEGSRLAFDEKPVSGGEAPNGEAPERSIQARIQDQTDQVVQWPLQKGVTYTLTFDVSAVAGPRVPKIGSARGEPVFAGRATGGANRPPVQQGLPYLVIAGAEPVGAAHRPVKKQGAVRHRAEPRGTGGGHGAFLP